MNLENIVEGLRVKNYKELCELLEVTPLEGNSKKAQIKDWERYFSFIRDKRAYIITKIFDVPKTSEDKRFKFKNFVDDILLNYLSQSPFSVTISYNDCYKIFDLPIEFTQKSLTKDLIKEYALLFDCKENSINYIIFSITSKIKDLFKKSLISFKKKELIDYAENWCIVFNDGNTKIATETEVAEYEQMQNIILEEMGYKNHMQINMSVRKKTLYWEKLEQMCKDSFGWKTLYKVFSINVKNKQFIDNYRDINISDTISQLHKSIHSSIKKDIDNKDKKSIEYMDVVFELLLNNDKVILEKYVYEDKDIEGMNFVLNQFL